MKITDRMIRKWIDETPKRPFSIFIPAVSPVETFFKQQKSTDILRYINSPVPVEESFLETAFEVCAERAGMMEEYLDCDFDLFPELWAQIEAKLRREQRQEARKKHQNDK